MSRLRIRIELNRGGVGVPLHKLASVVEEAQKFFCLLTEDVQIDQSKGEWLGFDFGNESLNFTAEFVGPVTAEQVAAFHAAFDGTTSLRRATISQFARITDAIEQDELIGFGLYLSDEGGEPTEWRCLSRRDALRITEEIQLLIAASGEEERESRLPAVASSGAGARVFSDRRERGMEAAKWAAYVREVEANVDRRITRVEQALEGQSGLIEDLHVKSSSTEDSVRKLLTAVEGFCAQTTRQLEAISAPVAAIAAAHQTEPAAQPVVVQPPVVETIHSPFLETAQTPIAETIQHHETDAVQAPLQEAFQNPAMETLYAPIEETLHAPVMETAQTPVTETLHNAMMETVLTPIAEAISDPIAETMHAPIMETAQTPVTETLHNPTMETILTPIAETISDPIAETLHAPIMETAETPVAEAVQNAIVEPVLAPIAETIHDPIAETMHAPIMETAETPVAEAVQNAIVEPVLPSIAETIEDPIAETMHAPITATVQTPVAEPVQKPIGDTVQSPIQNPVADTVNAPITANANAAAAGAGKTPVSESAKAVIAETPKGSESPKEKTLPQPPVVQSKTQPQAPPRTSPAQSDIKVPPVRLVERTWMQKLDWRLAGGAALLVAGAVIMVAWAWQNLFSGPSVQRVAATSSSAPSVTTPATQSQLPAPADQAQTPAPPSPTQQSETPTPGSTVQHVTLQASELTWVSAKDAAGTQILARVFDKGDIKTFDLPDGAIVRVGNAGGLSIVLNGTSIGNIGAHGQVRNVVFRNGSFKVVAAE